jgi:hypothetical protein
LEGKETGKEVIMAEINSSKINIVLTDGKCSGSDCNETLVYFEEGLTVIRTRIIKIDENGIAKGKCHKCKKIQVIFRII